MAEPEGDSARPLALAAPGQSAATPEDVAAELDVLASRVRRLSPPLASNPNRFHEERSDIAKDLADLVRRVSPRVGRRQPSRSTSASRGISAASAFFRCGETLNSTHRGRLPDRRVTLQ